MPGEGSGDLTDDPGAILTEDFESGDGGRRGRWGRFGVDGDGQAGLLERLQVIDELGFLLGGDLGAEDSGELSAEMGHATFEPIAAVPGDRGGHLIDEARAIGSEQSHDEMGVHGGQLNGREGDGKQIMGCTHGSGVACKRGNHNTGEHAEAWFSGVGG